MNVTAATGDDVGAVTELWVALAREQRDHGSHLLAAENREGARNIVAQYVHADGCAVAKSGSSVVGFVMFYVETGFFETDATRGVVENVYVLPNVRGRGVGSALLDYAEAELASRGADVVAIEALWDNEAARRLYGRRGYEPHRVTLEKSTDAPDDSAAERDESSESSTAESAAETQDSTTTAEDEDDV